MDARSLLRAQKATTKIEHPYASYSASGQLRCTICAAPVQKWDAHLLTKQHRTSVAREKAQLEKARQAAAKRQREAETSAAAAAKKARIASPEPEPEPEQNLSSSSALPAGFFSDVSRQNVQGEEDEEDVQDVSIPDKTGDAELDDFFASLAAPGPELEAPVAAAPTTAAGKRRQRETDDMTAEEIEAQTTYAAAPVRLAGADGDGEETGAGAGEPDETKAQKRERLARYDREEIMSRLMEEERAQEDADQRVVALKARMEAVKARRKAQAAAGGANGKAKPSKP